MLPYTVREIVFSLESLDKATTPAELASAIHCVVGDMRRIIGPGTVIEGVRVDGYETALAVMVRTPCDCADEAMGAAGEEAPEEA